MQEYTKTNGEPSGKRYFKIDENDCLIIPPKEVAPELYILGGFFNIHQVEFEKVVKQIAADNATSKIEDKQNQEEQKSQEQNTAMGQAEEEKEKVEDKVEETHIEEEQKPSIPLDFFANKFKQNVPQKNDNEYMDEDDFQPQPNLENVYPNQKQDNGQNKFLKDPQDYIDSLNDELPPENISIRAEDDEDIELHAQFDNTDYINSDIVSDDDVISEEDIQNGTGYEFEKEYAGSDEDTEDDSFSVL